MEPSDLRVQLEQSGRDVRGIGDWQISSDYLMSTDAFSFTTYSETPEFNLELQPVRLFVGGREQVAGRIDSSSIGGNGSSISYSGRDYIADLVECAIDPAFEIKEGEPLAAVIARACSTCGITSVISEGDATVRDLRTGVKKGATPRASNGAHGAKKQEYSKPAYGQGIFDYVSQLATRNGATIQPGNTRSALTLSAPNYTQAATYSLNRIIGPGALKNNIKTATATRDFGSVPSYVLLQGSQVPTGGQSIDLGVRYVPAYAPGAGAGLIGPAATAETASPARGGTKTLGRSETIQSAAFRITRELSAVLGAGLVGERRKLGSGAIPNGALYRLLAIKDTNSKNQSQLDETATLAISERLKDTLIYTVIVQGHIDLASGAAWAIDTVVDVRDDVCNIDEPMWVANRQFRFSGQSGTETEMTLWRPGVYLP